jgi:curved DNA-binding protein CbpA
MASTGVGGHMGTDRDYYAILGVLPSIDDVALAAVYRALLKKYHPDVFGGSKAEAERRTREIIEAYEVLGNAHKRRAYDTRKANGFGSYQEKEQTTGFSDDVTAEADKRQRSTAAQKHWDRVRTEREKYEAEQQKHADKTKEATKKARGPLATFLIVAAMFAALVGAIMLGGERQQPTFDPLSRMKWWARQLTSPRNGPTRLIGGSPIRSSHRAAASKSPQDSGWDAFPLAKSPQDSGWDAFPLARRGR